MLGKEVERAAGKVGNRWTGSQGWRAKEESQSFPLKTRVFFLWKHEAGFHDGQWRGSLRPAAMGSPGTCETCKFSSTHRACSIKNWASGCGTQWAVLSQALQVVLMFTGKKKLRTTELASKANLKIGGRMNYRKTGREPSLGISPLRKHEISFD